MNGDSILQIAMYLALLFGLSVPLGYFTARVFQDERTWLTPALAPIEKLIYRFALVDPKVDMNWREYAVAMLCFNIFGLFFLYALQRAQHLLPLNTQHLAAPSADLSFNTAVSFVTNTNWQSYSGETTLSYLTQMLGLTVQNFVSAATGIAVCIAFIRGFHRQERKGIGNFWSDLVKSTLYVLMPLAIAVSLFISSQGVVQTFNQYASYVPYQEYANPPTSAKGHAQNGPKEQLIALGPAASQVAIKQLGTNGGGFFNVNSSHPFENPTPLCNLVECLSILIIPAALCHTFGKLVNDQRQGWAIFAAMTIIFVTALFICYGCETAVNADFLKLGVQSHLGGNMEGKELRFGVVNSTIWATATSAASNGSVNSMHDSFNPIGGMMPMLLIQLGEVIYGGVGSGLYGMLIFAIITVFIAGLMVGRTPEYLGKKIEAFEVKMASLVILFPPAIVLLGTAIAVSVAVGRGSVFNSGPHAFSEILYAFSSAGNNNGSAFAGLNANVPFYNYMLGAAMFGARYWLAIPTLAIAGSLVKKKITPESLGTMPTHNVLFILLLTGVVLIFGALTFFPALALGPIAEHLLLFHSQEDSGIK